MLVALWWYCGVLLEDRLTLVDPDGSTYQYVPRGWVLGLHNPLKSYANLMYIYVTMCIFLLGREFIVFTLFLIQANDLNKMKNQCFTGRKDRKCTS